MVLEGYAKYEAVRAEAGKGFSSLEFASNSEFALKVTENHEMFLSKRVSHILGIFAWQCGVNC